jgi:hypothetical protein
MRSGADDLKLIASQMAKPALCHLAAARIPGAEEEHFLFHCATPA